MSRNLSTHSWIAKFFYKIFAMGANGADEVGQIEAILVTQGGSYQSEELGVTYGHESSWPIARHGHECCLANRGGL
jgi:hypothetical protein